MKRYLLVAGDQYYPERGTGDWIGCFDTYKEAEALAVETEIKELFSIGARKGQDKSTRIKIIIDGSEYDWYEIIDLKEWTS